jgi:ribosomal protein L12E/L44/L45/RPP1/RPP2
VNNKRISEFVMNVSIKRPQLEDASKAGKAAPGATAVPAAAAAAKKG